MRWILRSSPRLLPPVAATVDGRAPVRSIEDEDGVRESSSLRGRTRMLDSAAACSRFTALFPGKVGDLRGWLGAASREAGSGSSLPRCIHAELLARDAEKAMCPVGACRPCLLTWKGRIGGDVEAGGREHEGHVAAGDAEVEPEGRGEGPVPPSTCALVDGTA
jgi:hypothetical protein